MKVRQHNVVPICLIFLFASSGIVVAQKNTPTPAAHFTQQGSDQPESPNNNKSVVVRPQIQSLPQSSHVPIAGGTSETRLAEFHFFGVGRTMAVGLPTMSHAR